MATRAPRTNSGGQAGVRSRNASGGPVDNGVVFSTMKEFYLWVAIVTCLIVLLGFSIALALYADQRIRKAEIILQRAEQLEKKQKFLTRKDDE
jgi:hypothetical protein